MAKIRTLLAAITSTLLVQPLVTTATANENVRHSFSSGVAAQSNGDEIAADKQLKSPLQLPDEVRVILGLPESDDPEEGFGDLHHPFGTQQVSTADGIEPVNFAPWKATGKLFMKRGTQTFVCTASVVDKSLVVTAAHCIHDFGLGKDGFVEAAYFEPAHHDGTHPFGRWTVKDGFIPKVYHDGTDVCSAEAPGVVCANDIAILIVDSLDNKAIADVVGRYNLPPESEVGGPEYGYTYFLGQNSTQITQLGYPSADYDGAQMIRTDSLGYQQDPHNVIIGSNQTGGSSGGPWLINFGTETTYSGVKPSGDAINTIVAVTSWGFTSETAKVQGASRFARNSIYTTKSNIASLVESACTIVPDACSSK